MIAFLLAAICVAASPMQPLQKEQLFPEPFIEEIENGTITFAPVHGEEKSIKIKTDKVDTPRGTRIRVTAGSTVIEATRLKMNLGDGRIMDYRIDADGSWLASSYIRDLAPPPREK